MITRRSLPLSALRAFESASLYLHLGQAGESLGVTHGAISHQIKSLEKFLGLQLFTRDNNRLKLTQEGIRLHESVKTGFDTIVDGILNLDPDNIVGTLTIGCTQSTAANWATQHIMDFQMLYPEIEIDVVEIKSRQRTIPRNIEVAICYGFPVEGNREIELLSDLPVYPVGSPKLHYGVDAINKPERLLDFRLLGDNQNNWIDWFHAMGVNPTGQLKQTQFFSTVLSLNAARQGYGIALGNPFEIQSDLKEGRLIKFFHNYIPQSDQYYLLTNQPQSESLRARLFCNWIKRRLSQKPEVLV